MSCRFLAVLMFSATLLTTACATNEPGPPSTVIAVDIPALPPAALTRFCQEQPAECADADPVDKRLIIQVAKAAPDSEMTSLPLSKAPAALAQTALARSEPSAVEGETEDARLAAVDGTSTEDKTAPDAAMADKAPEEIRLSKATDDIASEAPLLIPAVKKTASDGFPPTSAFETGALEMVDLTDGTALFQVLMLKSRYSSVDLRRANTQKRVDSSEALVEQVRRVNREVNWAITPLADIYAYGQADRWAMPLSYPDPAIGTQGDCEDFVLEKRRSLIRAGIDRHALSMAVVHKPRVGMHAVLLIHTERGDLVLDNLSDRLLTPAASGYSFLLIQNGALDQWSVAHLQTITPAEDGPPEGDENKLPAGTLLASNDTRATPRPDMR